MSLRYRLHLLRPRYIKIRAMRVVCLVRGHRYGDIATRLLGVCDRCHFPFDGPDPDCGTPMCRCTADHMRCKSDAPVPARTWAMPSPVQVRKAPRRPVHDVDPDATLRALARRARHVRGPLGAILDPPKD